MPVAPAADAPHGPSCQRPPHGHQRHPLDLAHRQPLAGPARTLRLLEDGRQPVLPVAEGRRLGSGPLRIATAGRYGGAARRDASFRRQHGRPCSSASRRGQRGAPAKEAVGRSRGGFTTKVHLPCERSGKPLVVVLTAGERHEQPVLPLLMERGAVQRAGRGRPRIRPDRVAGDKGDSSPTVRRYLKERRIGAYLPDQRRRRPGSRLRPGRLPGAHPRGPPQQPPQAVAAHRDALREARRQRPNHDHGRVHPALVVKARHAPVSLAISVI